MNYEVLPKSISLDQIHQVMYQHISLSFLEMSSYCFVDCLHQTSSIYPHHPLLIDLFFPHIMPSTFWIYSSFWRTTLLVNSWERNVVGRHRNCSLKSSSCGLLACQFILCSSLFQTSSSPSYPPSQFSITMYFHTSVTCSSFPSEWRAFLQFSTWLKSSHQTTCLFR